MKSTKEPYVEGILTISAKGLGYLKQTDPKAEKIEIDPEFLNTGLNGDRVKVFLHPFRKGHTQTGEVTQIISRGKVGFGGILEKENGAYFLVPSDHKMYKDILIPEDKLKGAQVGQKVFGIITNWTDQKKTPHGEIVEVLGMPRENNAEMKAIALEKGFASTFPPEVQADAEKQKQESSVDAEASVRKDFRGTTTFTIDPADAKDFDDALSFKKLGDNLFEIGVHIADVSHYVQEGTALDAEAYRRATSVYLVDRTIPMLPEILSNDLCSLNPNVDRLTFSAVFEMNSDGIISKEWFGKTMIHSDKRFSYEEAQAVLDAKSGIYHDELFTMNSIAKKFTQKRFENGAVSLDAPEVRFLLDENGVPLSVYTKERGDTHRMIEEFMLLANKKVAEHIGKIPKGEKEKIFMYRIHDLPNKEKVLDLSFFLKKLGHPVKLKDGIIPPETINSLLASLEHDDMKATIQTAIIRSMAKAIYSTKNIGHFGLAFDYYTHFTSPIRRYPDLIVHRLLFGYLNGKEIKKDKWNDYSIIAEHCSMREKEAADAERQSIKYKQVEYMSTRIGQTFEGIISGVTEWALYVEEKVTRCEGAVRIRDIGNDFFVFDEKSMTLTGKKTKKTYRLGDTVKIKVKNADMQKLMIDYEFIA